MTNLAVLDSTLNINSPAIPLPPTSVGTFPSGKVFGCPKRRMHNRNHPTSDYKLSWLFIKCRRFRRSWSSTIESVEAVQKGAPAKAQQSGFGGERRSSGTTELLPRKAKRRMWSLRRRDGPKSRKLHQCEFVGRPHVSPPNPRIKARFQRAALGQGPHQSPTKWVWWGEEEQRND